MKPLKNLSVLAAVVITIILLGTKRFHPEYKLDFQLKKDTVLINNINHLDYQLMAQKEKMEESLVGIYRIFKMKITN